MKYKKPILIAEVGCNHKGDLNIAKKFIEVGKNFCDLKYIKIQKEIQNLSLQKKNIINLIQFKKTLMGQHMGNIESFSNLVQINIQILYDNCKLNGLIYSSSVWDLNSAKNIVNLNPEFIKIGSATNLNFEVLDFLCSNFTGKIHLSLGMTTQSEEENY